jgi:hypothetical protein
MIGQSVISKQSQDLRMQVEQLEIRMTAASCKVGVLRRQIQMARAVGAAAVLPWLFLIALTSLAAPGVQRVKAPFRVLDDKNHVIFEVNAGTHSLGLYRPDSQNTPGVIAAAPAGGHVFFKTLTPDSKTQAAFGIVDGKTPTMNLRHGGDDHNLLSMAVVDGAPHLNMASADGKNILELGEGKSRGGVLSLTNGDGGTVMQAGINLNDVGSVAVFPQAPGFGLPVAPIAGGAFALREEYRLPGTFICGTGCGQ